LFLEEASWNTQASDAEVDLSGKCRPRREPSCPPLNMELNYPLLFDLVCFSSADGSRVIVFGATSGGHFHC
jgi:hypothetical protein